jgi:hypothetical protein
VEKRDGDTVGPCEREGAAEGEVTLQVLVDAILCAAVSDALRVSHIKDVHE